MSNLPADYDPRVSFGKKQKMRKNWCLFYYLPNGERCTLSTGTSSKMKANELAKAKEADLLAGRFTDAEFKKLGPGFGTTELTIDEGVDRYLEITAAEKSPKTIQKERWDVKRAFSYFSEKHGVQLMRDIAPWMINDLVHKEKAHLAPTSRNNIRRAVLGVFNVLIKEKRFVGDNPATDSREVKVTKQDRERSVWIPYEHFKLLLEGAKQCKSRFNFYDMLELNWELALRRGEMLTLEWFQVDLERRLLKIVRKPNFPTPLGLGWSPKWGKERTLTLTDKAVAILKRQPKRVTSGTVGVKKDRYLVPTSLVFPRRARWEGAVVYLRCDEIKKSWHNAVKHAGLASYGYSWHDIRRSWNRLAAERGIPTAYRAAFLGHREEVNEGSYETEMAINFMHQQMGESMVPTGSESSSPVQLLSHPPVSRRPSLNR